MSDGPFDVAILGAGIQGLCAARALVRRGLRRIVVLDRFAPGHGRGSSHGRSRIIRSSYHDPLYVALAARARGEDWPRLARELSVTPITDTPGLFFGPDSSRLRGFVAATLAATADVDVIPPAEARRRFPVLTFAGAEHVLLDRTAGVIRADLVMASLRRWLAAAGVELRWDVRAHGLVRRGAALQVATDAGAVVAGRAVVAMGPWTPELVPALRPRLTVLRQHVVFLALDASPVALHAPAFPVWAWIGGTQNDFFYGLPDAGEGGVKVARHVVAGGPDDPEQDPCPSAAALAEAEAFARGAFTPAVRGRVHAETCLYTATADEHFVLDVLPGEQCAVVVSACSGHGFKFAPTIGELAAALLLDGTPPPAALGLAR